MCDATIATKLLCQLNSFLGRISPHFHKPVAHFIGDMMYGIMAEKDVKLTSIARSVARMSFRIHGVPDFHFYSIADGASDVLKRHGGRWRGFDQTKAKKEHEASLFAFFGMNTG